MSVLQIKRLFLPLLLLTRSGFLLAQTDSLFVSQLSVLETLQDTVVETAPNTSSTSLSISSDAIDQQVVYKANKYVKNDLINKQSILVGSAEVTYGNVKITADSIVFNMETGDVFASGISDSTGVAIGTPILSIGDQSFESDTLRYNFQTSKAVVKNIVTTQQGGTINSSTAKMLDDNTYNLHQSTYSTCENDTPHFYINLRKAKMYPEKKIVSGPANIVFEGIPLPIYLPFGYVPLQNSNAESGIIIPRYAYEENRGLALTNGGFYWAASPYFDLTLNGSIYANGTWLANVSSTYLKRYKYRGNIALSYANNISGHKGLDDYNKTTNYSIKWNYSLDTKARPGTSFSANVNMSSSGYDKNNSYDVTEHITTTKTSSISYSKKWNNLPFNITASMNHSQNSSNKTVSMSLPTIAFSMSRIQPFKRKNRVGAAKWYEDIAFQYTANFSNKINTQDSLMFKRQMFDNMKNGFQHSIPLSITFTPFSNFSITPSLSYKGVLYTEKTHKEWDEASGTILTDTLHGVYYGHAINPSISVGYTPQIFGIFQFTNPNWKLRAIRHVIKPSVSVNYVPYIGFFSSKMYEDVQKNVEGETMKYSIFENGMYGTPSMSNQSGTISIGLNNILEAKIRQGADSTSKEENVKLIDNLSFNTSYNIFADSLRWSPISMSFRTSILRKITISASGQLDPYAIDKTGKKINKSAFAASNKIARLTSLSASASFSLSDLLKDLFNGETNNSPMPQAADQSLIADRPSGDYPEFSMPWSMNITYNFSYSKPAFDPNISQTISINGNVSLTKNTRFSYTGGYDISKKRITATQFSISRDLHCWDLSIQWIPVGNMKSWSFLLKVKSSMLSDLKIERRKDFHDMY